MSQELLGNVFTDKGQPSMLCRLEVKAHSVTAIEARPAEGVAPRQLDFPLEADSLSFAGDGQSQVLLVNRDGAKLYCDRAKLVPALHQNGSGAVRAKLEGEGKKARREGQKAWAGLLAFAASIVLVCLLGLQLLNWTVDRAIDKIPVSWENSLGEVVASGLDGSEITDPAVVEPVQKVLDRVLAAAGEHPYSFKLHVVRNSQVNAMAAPGGHVIVYSGLLEKTNNPEELAGVLGHEIQHVLGRHGLRNVIHSLKWQLVASLVLGDVTAVQSVLLANGPQFLSLSHGRGLEEEADQEGARLLLRADIDPKGLPDFFRIMQQQEGVASYIPEFMSSHPETGSRIEAVEAFIAAQPEADGSYQGFDLDWEGMKKSLASDEPETASPIPSATATP